MQVVLTNASSLLRALRFAVVCSSAAVLIGFLGCCCPDSGPQTIATEDGLAEITVTNGMGKTSLMDNPEASLQVANIFRELYALIISESKREVPGINLDDYARLLREQHRIDISSPNMSEVEEVQINGLAARKWHTTGKMDDLKLFFIFGVVETDGHFNQVMTWTLEERRDKYEQVLDDIVHSFKLAQ